MTSVIGIVSDCAIGLSFLWCSLVCVLVLYEWSMKPTAQIVASNNWMTYKTARWLPVAVSVAHGVAAWMIVQGYHYPAYVLCVLDAITYKRIHG